MDAGPKNALVQRMRTVTFYLTYTNCAPHVYARIYTFMYNVCAVFVVIYSAENSVHGSGDRCIKRLQAQIFLHFSVSFELQGSLLFLE